VRVNGQPVLACMEEARDEMTIEPLELPIRKDSWSDMEPYLDRNPSLVPGAEFRMPTLDEVDAMKPLRSCIECLACCVIMSRTEVIDFAGPAAMREDMRSP